MTTQCTIEELFPGGWGIVAERRAEIEQSRFGAFDRILREEIDRRFLSAARVAQRMEASISTAWRWIGRSGARYIVVDGEHLYHLEDIDHMIADRITKKRQTKQGEPK